MSILYISHLTDALKLSHVPRWSIIDTTRRQSVADHSFRVAMIALTMAEQFHIHHGVDFDKLTIMELALLHDIEEAQTGDIPTPAKHKDEEFFPKSYAEWLVKMADKLEALIFLRRYGVRTEEIEKDHYRALMAIARTAPVDLDAFVKVRPVVDLLAGMGASYE